MMGRPEPTDGLGDVFAGPVLGGENDVPKDPVIRPEPKSRLEREAVVPAPRTILG